MGNFYKNVTLFGPARPDIMAALERYQRTAYISPTELGFTTVYDRDIDERGDPSELVLALPRFVVLFETFRHSLLMRTLKMPSRAAATGYKYIQQGEPPPGTPLEELEHIGESRPFRARL